MRRRTAKKRLFWALVILTLLVLAVAGFVARGAAALRAAASQAFRPALAQARLRT